MTDNTPLPSPASPPPLSLMGLNAHKSGMEGLDRDKINRVIMDASKGSKYYQNEVRKDQQIAKRVHTMLENLQKLTLAEKDYSMKVMDREAEMMEMSRNMSRIIVHVDMDAFYASVEMRDNPTLKDCPMAVGSNSMLCTSNYVARRYGVRAAMPGFIAKKLCPDLIIVKANFDKYQKVSKEVKGIFQKYDPNFCPVGLDEAYLDLTEYVNKKVEDAYNSSTPLEKSEGALNTLHETSSTPETTLSENQDIPSLSGLPYSHWLCAEQVVEEMRARIYRNTSLTASAGIAPNKMLAKVASDINKPNGQLLMEPTRDGILEFVHNLPIRKVSGIGKVTERLLNALKITDCHHLYENRNILHLLFSKTSSRFFLSISLGISSTEVQRAGERKSISIERSFNGIGDPKQHMVKCKELCQSLSEDMREKKIYGRTITLKLKTVDFEVKYRGLTVSNPVSSYEELYQIASKLLQHEITASNPAPLLLRLIGIRVSTLYPYECENTQGTLKSFLKSTIRPIHDTSKVSNSDHLIQQAVMEPYSLRVVGNSNTSEINHLTQSKLPAFHLPVNESPPITCGLQHVGECLNMDELGAGDISAKTKTERQSYKRKSNSNDNGIIKNIKIDD